MILFRTLAVTLGLAFSQVSAKAVFAHFMIGNTGTYTTGDFVNDMQIAQQSLIDGFALNMAYNEPQNDHSIPLAFAAAAQVQGFKLFFSFDYAGHGAWPKDNVTKLLRTWSSHGSYFRHSTGQPLASTFEGPKNAGDWKEIKQNTNAFFVPSYSSLGAKKALDKGDGVADGLFNWGAWPEGTTRTNVELDASYMIFLNKTRTYMAPVSPWFYTNMPGFDKNWLWQGGTLWYERFNQLSILTKVGKDSWPNQPEYLQIISWNDYGESHYIGPLNEKGYLAFGQGYGNSPFNYATGHPHDGWRHMLPYMITMWKTGTAVVTEEVLTAWYRLTPASTCATGGTIGNNPDQLQVSKLPVTVSPDRIYFSALLTGLANPYVTLNGQRSPAKWDMVPDYSATNYVGVYYGSFDTGGVSGSVKIELVNSSGNTIATLNGESLKSSCAGGVMNWNAWVGTTKGSRAVSATSPKSNLSAQQCIEGAGTKPEFNSLCTTTCRYGYCPPGPCVCYKMGLEPSPLKETNTAGYPLPGSDCTYLGLCSWGCNHGVCPADKCTTDASAKGKCVIPAPDPEKDDDDVACTSGSGEGNFGGLCGFSCGRGFCPIGPCKCTGRGPKITPPPVTKGMGYVASTSLGVEYKGLCEFACARDYCPPGACSYTSPWMGGMFFEIKPQQTCDKSDPNWWSCRSLDCSVAGKYVNSKKKRWDSVGVDAFFNRTRTWFGNFNDFSDSSNPTHPWYNTPFRNNAPEAIVYFFAGQNDKGGNRITQTLNCGLLTSGGACSNPNDYVCGTTQYPALDLMLTSFVNMHNFYKTLYDAYKDSQLDLVTKVTSVADTFFKNKGNALEIFRKVLSLFSWILTIVGGQFWAELFRIGAFTDSVATVSSAVDTFTSSFEFVASAAQSNVQTQAGAAKDLQGVVDAFYQGSKDSLDAWMKKTFTGNFQAYSNLYGHIKDGIFLDAPPTSERDLSKRISAVVKAKSIIQTWKYESPIAIIFQAGDHQKPAYDLINSARDADAMRVRVDEDGADYTLWIAQSARECQGSGNGGKGSCLNGAYKPHGIENIDSQDNEWGVSKADIALASFYRYMRDPTKFNLPQPEPKGKGLDPKKFADVPYGAGMRTPGMYKIPICEVTIFYKNIREFGMLPNERCEWYPCCDF